MVGSGLSTIFQLFTLVPRTANCPGSHWPRGARTPASPFPYQIMKSSYLLAATLLGLGLSFSAHAQTPVVGAPGAMSTPGAPATPAAGIGTIVPGQPSAAAPGTGVGSVIGTTTTPPAAGAPMGTTAFPGGVPARRVDAGALRTNQPVGSPAAAESPSARRLNSRARTTNTNTSTPRP